MTRLQKKCLIAAAGTHLLVVVVVLCSGFITAKPKVDDSQVLEMISPTVLDHVLNTGVASPQPPPPAPPVQKPPEPTPPIPDPPKPEVKPLPQPKPDPEPIKLPDPVKPLDNPDIQIPKPPKQKHIVKVNKDIITVDNKQVKQEAAEAKAQAEREAKREAQRKADLFRKAASNILQKSSPSTQIEMKGTSSVSFANYASLVKSRYDGAWSPPDDMASDDVTTKVSVTISRDGSVVSARIISRSGEARVDASVQRALDRVDFIGPFPDGAKEKERTFIINFNPQARRLNG